MLRWGEVTLITREIPIDLVRLVRNKEKTVISMVYEAKDETEWSNDVRCLLD